MLISWKYLRYFWPSWRIFRLFFPNKFSQSHHKIIWVRKSSKEIFLFYPEFTNLKLKIWNWNLNLSFLLFVVHALINWICVHLDLDLDWEILLQENSLDISWINFIGKNFLVQENYSFICHVFLLSYCASSSLSILLHDSC